MARPKKQGLDYFPLDCDFFSDEKMVAIAGKYGIEGEILTVKLLCAIYRRGYYVEWNEMMKYKLLSQLPGMSPERLDEIVARLVSWGFFDRGMFEGSNVLTSESIQEVYFEASKFRKLDGELPYLLGKPRTNYANKGISQTLTPQSPQPKGANERVSQTLTSKSQTLTKDSQEKMQEIKVKEIKVNKIKKYPPSSDTKKTAEGSASSVAAGDIFGEDLTDAEVRSVKIALAKAIALSQRLANEFGVTAEAVMEAANDIADRWLVTGEFDRKRTASHMLNAIGKKLCGQKQSAPKNAAVDAAAREEERRARREEERLHASQTVSADEYLKSIGAKPGESMAKIAQERARKEATELPADVMDALDSIRDA